MATTIAAGTANHTQVVELEESSGVVLTVVVGVVVAVLEAQALVVLGGSPGALKVSIVPLASGAGIHLSDCTTANPSCCGGMPTHALVPSDAYQTVVGVFRPPYSFVKRIVDTGRHFGGFSFGIFCTVEAGSHVRMKAAVWFALSCRLGDPGVVTVAPGATTTTPFRNAFAGSPLALVVVVAAPAATPPSPIITTAAVMLNVAARQNAFAFEDMGGAYRSARRPGFRT